MAGLRQLGLTDGQAIAAVTRQTTGQAYLLASTDLFYISVILCLMLVGVVWITRRPKPMSGPVAAG